MASFFGKLDLSPAPSCSDAIRGSWTNLVQGGWAGIKARSVGKKVGLQRYQVSGGMGTHLATREGPNTIRFKAKSPPVPVHGNAVKQP